MGTHPRTLIRRAARDALIGRTSAQGRVEASRRAPWRAPTLPAISVYCDDDVSELVNIAPRELERHVEMVIQGAVMLNEGVDDEADAFALDIEVAIDADRFLGGTAGDAILKKSELIIDEEGERPVAVVRMTYDVLYHSYACAIADPDSMADFATAAVSISPLTDPDVIPLEVSP